MERLFDFGMRIRELREKRKLSQAELGRKIGRSKSVVCSYENNMKMPPLGVLMDLAAVFHVSLDHLVGIDKHQMVSIEGMTEPQKALMELLVVEFKDPAPRMDGLSPRQQEILSGLMKEFSKK